MPSKCCAPCKKSRRRCLADCVFAPYFPAYNDQLMAYNLQRFLCVHEIYGESKFAKMLKDIPERLRADAVESLCYEAKCRTQDRVYGCVGIITLLHQQIQSAESELAKVQAEIAFVKANGPTAKAMSYNEYQQPMFEPKQAVGFNVWLPKQDDVVNLDGDTFDVMKLSSPETNVPNDFYSILL